MVTQKIAKVQEHRIYFDVGEIKSPLILYGVPYKIDIDPNIILLKESSCNDTESTVDIDGQLLHWFAIKIGLSHGWRLFSILYLS